MKSQNSEQNGNLRPSFLASYVTPPDDWPSLGLLFRQVMQLNVQLRNETKTLILNFFKKPVLAGIFYRTESIKPNLLNGESIH